MRPAVRLSMVPKSALRPTTLGRNMLVRGLSTSMMPQVRSSLFSSPFDDFYSFPTVQDFFQQPFARPRLATEQLWSGPKIDIVEGANKFTLTAELPGVKKEDVKIQIDSDRRRLMIEGQLKSSSAPVEAKESSESDSQEVATQEQEAETVGHALVSERVFGSFARSFTLPPTADFSNDAAVKARFDNGLLIVDIPKRLEQHSKTKQITIESA